MKVFLIQAGWDYEGTTVIHVASSLEKADAYIASIKKTKQYYDYDSVTIEDMDIDKDYYE